jgi:hypothetical protein
MMDKLDQEIAKDKREEENAGKWEAINGRRANSRTEGRV